MGWWYLPRLIYMPVEAAKVTTPPKGEIWDANETAVFLKVIRGSKVEWNDAEVMQR